MSASTFKEFVSVCCDNSQTKAADLLGLKKSHVSRICSGERGITPALASRIEEVSEGRYSKEALIWPEVETENN